MARRLHPMSVHRPSDMHTTLVSVGTLAQHLTDSRWLIVDCRFDLAQPAAGEAAYHAGHIPGAIYAHLDRDLSSPITPTTGRHPLPDPERFAQTLSRWGVGADTQVIAYDADNGMYASRLWWLLRWVGHRAVAVLDGGFKAWTAAGQPASTEIPARPPTQFQARPNRELWLDADEVQARVQQPDWRLLDARAPSASSAKSSRSTKSPATCQALATIRSRPISPAKAASARRKNYDVATSSRRRASPTITPS